MKRRILAALVALLGLLTSVSCTGSPPSKICATYVAPAVSATVASIAATQTAAVPPTRTPLPEVTLKSSHGRYVTALQEGDGWALKQLGVLSECGVFTQDVLADGKITLKTCNGRYVTAPRSGSTRADWQVWQDSEPGDCAQFTRESYDQGVALKACAGKYLTAGDAGWPSPLQWSVVSGTDEPNQWEVFTIEPQP
jgi:hypothetical protein